MFKILKTINILRYLTLTFDLKRYFVIPDLGIYETTNLELIHTWHFCVMVFSKND